MNEFLKQNNLCENLIIQGKLDLLHHQFKRNEKIGKDALHLGIKLIDCYILWVIAHLLVKIISTFSKKNGKK
jgi:hypothetical protein